MTRTAHHISTTQLRSPRSYRRALRTVIVTDLRYSATVLTEARHQGRRPRPQAIRRVVEFYSFPRSIPRDRDVARQAGIDERRARQVTRHDLDAIRRLVNSGGRLRPEVVDQVDVAPTRHRQGAVWHAW